MMPCNLSDKKVVKEKELTEKFLESNEKVLMNERIKNERTNERTKIW